MERHRDIVTDDIGSGTRAVPTIFGEHVDGLMSNFTRNICHLSSLIGLIAAFYPIFVQFCGSGTVPFFKGFQKAFLRSKGIP